MSAATDYFTHAIDMHRAGQLDRAAECYRQALQADPQNADAWHFLGALCTNWAIPGPRPRASAERSS